jgi:hypothetical protein
MCRSIEQVCGDSNVKARRTNLELECRDDVRQRTAKKKRHV